MGVLRPRYTCYVDEFGFTHCDTAWSTWGRWVAFAVIVALAFIIFFVFACLSARARRRRGLNPYFGTSWMAPSAYNQQDYGNPPPQYSPGPNQGYYAPNQGYFGGQQTGIELQQPANAYHAGDQVYPPPPGPPPSKSFSK
ncbi:hypothetical protein VTN77DRAFT_3641 [Rasamsonia byssochlamydoides]|uniref:uncharacterized protein n=1 Tax=Rasamsonia byssochlamydoides TaxID=89139 RepID=UPI0037444572